MALAACNDQQAQAVYGSIKLNGFITLNSHLKTYVYMKTVCLVIFFSFLGLQKITMTVIANIEKYNQLEKQNKKTEKQLVKK